jgi:hypothetical protein
MGYNDFLTPHKSPQPEPPLGVRDQPAPPPTLAVRLPAEMWSNLLDASGQVGALWAKCPHSKHLGAAAEFAGAAAAAAKGRLLALAAAWPAGWVKPWEGEQ